MKEVRKDISRKQKRESICRGREKRADSQRRLGKNKDLGRVKEGEKALNNTQPEEKNVVY